MDTQAARQAITDLRSNDYMMEQKADDLLKLLLPRLQHCSGYNLKELKKALRPYNVVTGKWQERFTR